VLGLASPTYPLAAETYKGFTATYCWKEISDQVSLPFAPEIVLPTLQYFNDAYPDMTSEYGFKCSFNRTFTEGFESARGWVSKGYYGLDQGPVMVMIENYRTGFFWDLMKQCPYLTDGLRRAGFTGGWL
jgi:hypothetical protein